MWDKYGEWDYDDYMYSEYYSSKKKWDEKLYKKYTEGFEEVKPHLVELIKNQIKEKWKFSEKITEKIINEVIKSFKNGVVNDSYNKEEDIMSYFNDIVYFYCQSEEQDILESLNNL